MAHSHSQELENWDDDFDFGSPRNSPVPTAAPIHHAVHRTRSQAYQQRSHANLHSQSSLEHGLTHRQTASRTNLGSSSSRGLNHPPSTTYLRPKENRQARYSGNSEDWDMDMADTTARVPPLPPPPAMPLASTSAAPKPPPLSVVPTAPSPQQLVDHDSQIIHHLNARRSPEPSENVSPTMSAFSIPLSANSSVRNPAHSIGGSSTNFLLHSGRRSLLEMEKGRQDRERRRLRKKSRPSGVGVGGAPMMDDDDDLDAHEAYLRASGSSSGVPRRYMPPPRAAGAGGDSSSSELDESGDDRGNLSELEEELASPSKVARVDPSSARIPRQQPPSTNTNANLKPSSSRPTLSGVISTSRGLISSVVTSTPPSSNKTLPAHSPSGAAAAAPPSKLSRKTSNSNVIQKSSHHSNSTPFLSSGGGGSGSGAIKSKSSVQPSAPITSPQAQIHAKSIEPTTTSMSATTSMSPPRRSIDINSIHTTNQHQQQQQYEEGAHLNDCGSSIAASSHKARQPLLSRLSSLKRWGKAHSPSSLLSSSKLPSMSGVAFPTNLSSTDFRSGSPSPSPPHVSPMTSPQKPAVPSSSSTAATPSRSKFGLLRRPSLQFRNNESAAANESTSTPAGGAAGGAPGGAESATNPQVSTLKDEGRRGLNPFRRVSITGMKRLVGDPHHSSTDLSTNPPTKTPDSKRSSYKPESSTQTPASENKSSGSAHQRTLSFMNRMRSKSGGNESPSQAKPTINSVVSAAGSAAGVGAGASNGESSSATRAPHTVGRSAAMAKAPKPPVRTAMGMMMIGTSTSNKNKNKNENESSTTSSSSSPVPSSPASTNSPRQLPLPLPLPSPRSQSCAMSPLPTFETNANANSKGSARSSTLMTTPKGDRRAMHPHTHTHTPLSSDQDVTPRPSRHRQPEPTLSSRDRDRDRDRTTPSHHHHHHERERTAKGTMPMPMPMSMSSSSSISRATSGSGSGSGSGSVHVDSTPRALKTSKALPPTTTTTTTTTADLLSSGAMTMGRVSGSNAMMVERKEKEGGVRRSSVGANADSSTTTTATTTTPSRRRGDLKIPTMISMKQGALKRELEAVKEFATGVEDLKRLQSSYQSMVSHVSKGRNTSSRTAARQLSVVENIGSQYSIWWECADLLIELGGAAPPTVAGTPMYENENPHLGGNSNAYAGRTDTISMSSANSYGTQRSHTSTSSNGDLSNRQLQLLRQMLMTPNPRSFHDPALLSHPMKPSGSQATLSSEYSSTQSAEMSGTPSRLGHRRGELSGSGSDHMMSDMGSRRGTKSSIDSGDSTHRSTREFVLPTNSKSPYTPGTWRDKAGKTSSSSNRPSLAGMFAKPTDATASSGSNARSSKGAATASRGTLDGSNSSSAAGRGTTDDDDDISDWDAESETGDKPSSLLSGGGGSRYLTTPSTTSSSFDALPTKLALTPENIAPLLEYAREVKVRLYDCLDRLSRELKAASSSSSSGAAPPSAHMSSRDRSTTTTTAGTSSMKRA